MNVLMKWKRYFAYLCSGDYIMGGVNDNSHGILIDFPDKPVHKNMPKNGPDRRFMAMPAYLGEDNYPYYNPTMGVIGRQLLDWIHEE